MESDKEIYKIFKAMPEAFFTLTGIPSRGKYSFHSVTINEFKRTMDGLMESDDPEEPCWVIEFQNQKKDNIYQRTVIEMACISLQNPKRICKGVILFGTLECDPKTEPWYSISQNKNGFYVFYLKDLIEKLARKKTTSSIGIRFPTMG